jgi:acetyl esterase/lipase
MLMGIMYVPASQTKSPRRRRAGSLLAWCLRAVVISSLLVGAPWLPPRDAASTERAELYAGRAEPGFEQADPFEARSRYRYWLEDPRAPSETPAEIEPGAGRRWSWRSQRRASRRRLAAERALAVEPDGPTAPAEPDGPTEPAEPDGPTEPAEPDGKASASDPGDDTRRGAGLTFRDQPYREPDPGVRRRFDITLPGRCPGPVPLVVWIHGDTWRDGSKADCPVTWLALEGYAVASIGYRTSDLARFPAQLDDCRAAIAEIVRRAGEWGLDPTRIAVVGHGGGGLLAALVGLADDPTGDEAAAPRFPPAAVAMLSAPTDLTSLGPEHDRPRSPASLLVGGPLPEVREAALRASPVWHVSPDDPPCLVIHGTADSSVPVEQALRLDAALSAVGVPSTLLLLDRAGHAASIGRDSPAGRAILEFLDAVLRPAAVDATEAADASQAP